MTVRVQKILTLDENEILGFCGYQDQRLRKIQSRLKAKIVPRGNELRISGSADDVENAFRIVSELLATQRANRSVLTERQIHHALAEGDEGGEGRVRELLEDVLPLPNRNRGLTPLTRTQKLYLDAMRAKDVVVCIGPAGTGKTYLAMAMAVWSLVSGRVGRIILVRPVVEAGESLGFLPGDIAQKLDPYVRPLYDALYEMMEAEKIREFVDRGTIEIAPLAYMRGRTLNNCFAILDEAQNTSTEQMKMFLTRMGFQSKFVVTGDVTQVDLPRSKPSGLVEVQRILASVPEIEFVRFSRKDVVRHELVQKIVEAYEADGQK